MTAKQFHERRSPTLSESNNGKVQQPAHVGTLDNLACLVMQKRVKGRSSRRRRLRVRASDEKFVDQRKALGTILRY
jgi:hypothetical protein